MVSKRAIFLSGPNLWSSLSGLVIIETGAAARQAAAWRPKRQGVQDALDLVHKVVAIAAESELLTCSQHILDADLPFAELLVATTEILVRDFCVKPAKGSVIGRSPDQLRFFVPCDESKIGESAWVLSNRIAGLASSGSNGNENVEGLRHSYRDFRSFARRHGLNQSTLALARGAMKRDIPSYRIVQPGQLLQLGQGCFRRRVTETATDEDSPLGTMIARDKFATGSLLASNGIPTSGTRVVQSGEDAIRVARELGFPLVIKPRASTKGMGVTTGITCEDDVVRAFDIAAMKNTGVLIERHIAGDDHRLLVVGGRFVAAARRIPAFVMGDGRHTVRELIDRLNRDPRRGMPFERLLERIEIDLELERLIAQAGLALDSVPKDGQHLALRSISNISRGGVSVDVTDQIHPDNRLLSERIARLVGVVVIGIDFMSPDIGQSWRAMPCGILEVNASPGLRPHLGANPARDVVGPIMDELFPARSSGRVPTAAVTGSVGKTTTCTMTASILSDAGMTVARSTTQGAWIGAEQIFTGDHAGGWMARSLLQDPGVEAGVFEFGRGGLIKRGMGLDSVDVGAVLNIHDNHLGLDGVRTREDLARAKRLVVQNARKAVVLNADDPLCLAMRDCAVGKEVCLVSVRPDNPAVLSHLRADGVAAYMSDSSPACEIRLFRGSNLIGKIAVAAIPATLGGAFRPAAYNALFATTIAYAMGVSYHIISAALEKFQSTSITNPGRMNFIDGLPYTLILTWADGREACGELADFVHGFDTPGTKGILITGMGNRPDSYLADMAKSVAGVFQRYVCSDWVDLRGRPAGVVASVLAEGLMASGVSDDRIVAAPSYEQALERALRGAAAGDLLVILNFNYPGVESLARAMAAGSQPPNGAATVPGPAS